jgi:hypothetical protein
LHRTAGKEVLTGEAVGVVANDGVSGGKRLRVGVKSFG